MKKILLVSILIIPLMLITGQTGNAVEPPNCQHGFTIIGPPIVGTFVVDLMSVNPPGSPFLYTLSAEFNGCCADCFSQCKASCNVKFKFTFGLNLLPEEIPLTFVQNQNLPGFGPKNCNPAVGGFELKDLVIHDILTFEKKDIDRDGVNELVANVVMYYWQCNP